VRKIGKFHYLALPQEHPGRAAPHGAHRRRREIVNPVANDLYREPVGGSTRTKFVYIPGGQW
jgi:hypothetical protein